jgi:hypothetical protein
MVYLTTSKAAQQAAVAPSTIHFWLAKYPDLGRKVGGRWRLDPDRLQRILDGSNPLRRGR